MTTTAKTQLVTHLVDQELRGWRAGWSAGERCALHHLTVEGFQAVTTLKEPKFKLLHRALMRKGRMRSNVGNFWLVMLGRDFKEYTSLPAFTSAFVKRVREVWEEVREEVMSELEACPGRSRESAPEQEEVEPARPIRREPSKRRGARRPDLGDRW